VPLIRDPGATGLVERAAVLEVAARTPVASRWTAIAGATVLGGLAGLGTLPAELALLVALLGWPGARAAPVEGGTADEGPPAGWCRCP
jgi:hypothetical protein